MNAAIIVAAGRGNRMGGPTPKQYRNLGPIPILRHTLLAFLHHPEIGHVQVVIHANDAELYGRATSGLELPPPVIGGSTRQESVRSGLQSMAELNPAKVLVHDAVRPFVAAQSISAVLAKLDTAPAVIIGVPVVDTLKRAPGGVVTATVDRTDMWRAQTPQGFLFPRLLAAYQKLHALNPQSGSLTDDSLVAESDGMPVTLVLGSEDNIKITTEADWERAERFLAQNGARGATPGAGDAHGRR